MAMTASLGAVYPKQDHHEDALSVREAELSMMRRLGASEETLLIIQGNLASTYSRAWAG